MSRLSSSIQTLKMSPSTVIELKRLDKVIDSLLGHLDFMEKLVLTLDMDPKPEPSQDKGEPDVLDKGGDNESRTSTP